MPLYIYESSVPTVVQGNLLPVVYAPPIAEQKLTVSGTSTQSAVFNTNTRMVALHTSEVCSVAFGSNPTATVNTKRMAANTTEYFEVKPGDRVAVITNT